LGEPLRAQKKTAALLKVLLFFFVARVGLFAVRFAHTCAALRTFGALRLLGTARLRAAATIPLAANDILASKFHFLHISTKITDKWVSIK
jgi:hypothetical protein